MIEPLVPRPIDLPTAVPLGAAADLSVLDGAKILAAPSDRRDWPAWRRALERWRDDARVGYDGRSYERPELAWTQDCFAVALVWLWDDLLYDRDSEQFTPERLLDEGVRDFGGYDAVVLWHAYPVIGIDERNQFDFYRDVVGIRELVAAFRSRGVRVFVDYNPWDVGTRREPVPDEYALADLVAWLDVDGVFLDTLKQAPAGLRAHIDAQRPGVAFEGESTLPLARLEDHHLSWAQWFADSEVPGVIRARWFEQRHMLHHTRRWNRDHTAELHSAWLNGVGMLIWENVFGSWVGWSAHDRALLRAMLEVQRAHADLLTGGEWTPLAASSEDLEVVGSRWRRAGDELWTLVNRLDRPFAGEVSLDGREALRLELEPRGIAAVVGAEAIVPMPDPDRTYPARQTVRVRPPRAEAAAVPDGMVEAPAEGHLTAIFRRRETGIYGDVPYVEEWKPLPPRLHDLVEVPRARSGGRYAIARDVACHDDGSPLVLVSLDEARAFAAERGARLPTEDEWQLAAEAGLLTRPEPEIWEWTESEHRDGRTRFAILKGGSGFDADGSDWYVDGGAQLPSFSLQLLLTGRELQRSPWIGFRLAVDL